MDAAPVFASSALSSGLPPIPTADQAKVLAYGHANLAATAEAVKEASAWAYPLRREVGRVIVGQKYLIDRLLIALIATCCWKACRAWRRRWHCAPSPQPCR
jgi:hypothetical protein